MRKVRFFANLEKEEAWLNDMSEKGWALVGYELFVYSFAKIESKKQEYCIDYRSFQAASEFERYASLFSDSGWRHVAGTEKTGFQYFVKAKEGAAAQVFSDNANAMCKYSRTADLYLALFFVYLALAITYLMGISFDMGSMLAPASMYKTANLWDMEGLNFWIPFIYETPVIVGRYFVVAMAPIMLGAYSYYASKTKRLKSV